jgi:hypothetical protein
MLNTILTGPVELIKSSSVRPYIVGMTRVTFDRPMDMLMTLATLCAPSPRC